MVDPVILPCGHSFERQTLRKWVKGHGKSCPVDGEAFKSSSDIKPNFRLQWEILFWQRQQQQQQHVVNHIADESMNCGGYPTNTQTPVTLPTPPPPSRSGLDSPPSRPQRRGSIDLNDPDTDAATHVATKVSAPASPSTLRTNASNIVFMSPIKLPCRPAFLPGDGSPGNCSNNSSHEMCAIPQRTSSSHRRRASPRTTIRGRDMTMSLPPPSLGLISLDCESPRMPQRYPSYPSYPQDISHRTTLDIVNDAIALVEGIP